MITLPKALWAKFDSWLVDDRVDPGRQAEYRKWLRYYLDFCHKYNVRADDRGVRRVPSSTLFAFSSISVMGCLALPHPLDTRYQLRRPTF
jgi:hypothetical protein